MNIAAFLTQNYGKLTFLDLILICTYLVLCLYVGFKNAGKIKNIKDYALGSGEISTAALVATLYATHLGARSTIGMIQRITEIGALFAIIVLLSPMRFIVSLAIYRHIEQFRGCITSSDIMARLYDTPGRFVMNISILTHSIATVAAQNSSSRILAALFLRDTYGSGHDTWLWDSDFLFCFGGN